MSFIAACTVKDPDKRASAKELLQVWRHHLLTWDLCSSLSPTAQHPFLARAAPRSELVDFICRVKKLDLAPPVRSTFCKLAKLKKKKRKLK